jgi:hypothetical protein
MTRVTLCTAAAFTISLCTLVPANATCLPPTSFYGEYRADDGGTYYVRQIGNDVWWVGMSSDNGKSWTNVFHGQIKGNRFAGGWLDVPKGGNASKNAGKLTVTFDTFQRFKKVDSPTGPSASRWEWVCHDTN